MNSILTSIKKMLGISEEYNIFDADIVMHINSVFMTLTQLGVGPAEGFEIQDELATWDEFLDDPVILNTVKTYMYLKVRMLFDPPTSTALIDAMNRQANELEWRLNVQVESNTASSEKDL